MPLPNEDGRVTSPPNPSIPAVKLIDESFRLSKRGPKVQTIGSAADFEPSGRLFQQPAKLGPDPVYGEARIPTGPGG